MHLQIIMPVKMWPERETWKSYLGLQKSAWVSVISVPTSHSWRTQSCFKWSWGKRRFSVHWLNAATCILSAPLLLDMLPWVWLSQIRWWYPVVKGGSSWSISVSLWYPDLHWKSCRLDVQQQAQNKCRKDWCSSCCIYLFQNVWCTNLTNRSV